MRALSPAYAANLLLFAASLVLMIPAAVRGGQEDAAPVETIRQALDSGSADRQRAGLVLIPELRLQGQQATAVVKQLTEYLRKTTDAERRALALRAYGRLARGATAAPVLNEHLGSPAPGVRAAAATALVDSAAASARAFDRPGLIVSGGVESISSASGGPAAVAWTRGWAPGFLKEQDVFLSFTDDCKQLLPVAARALGDADESVRAAGAEAIRILARAIADALPDPTLATTETRSIDPVEAKLKWVLLRPAFDALNANAGALKGALTAPHPDTRQAGVRAAAAVAQARAMALASRGPQPDSLMTILGQDDAPDALRRAVADLLPTLAERLQDESPDVRLTAAEAFELAGPEARTQLGDVIRASTNRDIFVRWAATRALGRMFAGASPEESARIIAALRARVADQDLDVRNAALTALSRGGPAARSATDAVVEAVIQGDPDQRVAAMRTLQLIEADRIPTIAALTASLQADVPRVRKAALLNLAAIGTAAKPALPEVRKLLRDHDEEVRREAAQAILAIDREL